MSARAGIVARSAKPSSTATTTTTTAAAAATTTTTTIILEASRNCTFHKRISEYIINLT
jgi:hypothetical protein